MRVELKALMLAMVLAGAAALARGDDSPGDLRRQLVFHAMNSDAPGENIAWADFYADASHKADGSDLRVVNAAGAMVAMQVMYCSALEDRVRIAFATRTEGPYVVTWGNAPDKAAPALEIKRGVFAEVYRLPAGNIRTPETIDQAFQKGGPRITSAFVNELSLGYAPAGPQEDVMMRYSSQVKVPATADYDIAFTVAKSGYVAIDGKVVSSDFGGRMMRDVRNAKTVNLSAGWHSITATQLNRGLADTGIEVAWRKTGDPKFVTIPNTAGVARAVDGIVESAKQPLQADFSIEPMAEGFFTPESFCPRYVFEARIAAAHVNDKASFAWDFGDGQTAAVRRPNHYFLSAGVYPVTLTMQLNGVTCKATRRILVMDRLVDLYPTPPEDAPKAVASVIDAYDPTKLNFTQALRGTLFYQKQNNDPAFLVWGKAWLQKKDTQDQNVVAEVTGDLAQKWIDKGDSGQAALAFDWASQKNIHIDARARLMFHAVVLYAGEAGKADNAQTLANMWNDQLGTSAKPIILAAQAYAAIAKGDGKHATELVALAKKTDEKLNRQQISQGVMTRNVEAYIGTKEYAEAEKILDDWEINYPETLVEGYSRLLRVKLLVARNHPVTAGAIAVEHARALPQSFYAAELLYRAAEAYLAANHPADAKAAMDVLKAKYPESPYANGQGAK